MIRSDDFQPNTTLQHCWNIVLNSFDIVPTLQRCTVLKIFAANRPVHHHLQGRKGSCQVRMAQWTVHFEISAKNLSKLSALFRNRLTWLAIDLTNSGIFNLTELLWPASSGLHVHPQIQKYTKISQVTFLTFHKHSLCLWVFPEFFHSKPVKSC